jgi:flagellar biosynthesis/type III secretory pathway chaperone
MDKITCHNQFKHLLDQELGYIRELLDILTQERDALSQDSVKIEAISTHKAEIITRLEQAGNLRTALLQDVGYAADKQGMDTCIQWCDNNNVLQSRWQDLLNLTTQCRDNNHVNGMIIESSRRSIHQALSILYGQPANNVYSASGQAEEGGLSRTIAKA